MKGLKKIALVSAIAAVSSVAQAELKALDDTVMGDLTGQAGISIELDTNVDIGGIVYTDTDTGGKFAMSNIALGGAGNQYGDTVNVNLDDLKIDIDIEADGDAVIDISNKNGNAPIDFGLDIGSAALVAADNSENTVLLSAVNLDGAIVDHILARVDTATDTLNFNTGFVVADFSATVDFLAVGVTGGKIGALSTDWSAVASATNSTELTAALAGTPSTGSNGVTNLGARVDVTVGTGTNAAGATALQIDVNEFGADIYMAGITIGGTSIGSVLIDDLVVKNTSMVVYGH